MRPKAASSPSERWVPFNFPADAKKKGTEPALVLERVKSYSDMSWSSTHCCVLYNSLLSVHGDDNLGSQVVVVRNAARIVPYENPESLSIERPGHDIALSCVLPMTALLELSQGTPVDRHRDFESIDFHRRLCQKSMPSFSSYAMGQTKCVVSKIEIRTRTRTDWAWRKGWGWGGFAGKIANPSGWFVVVHSCL